MRHHSRRSPATGGESPLALVVLAALTLVGLVAADRPPRPGKSVMQEREGRVSITPDQVRDRYAGEIPPGRVAPDFADLGRAVRAGSTDARELRAFARLTLRSPGLGAPPSRRQSVEQWRQQQRLALAAPEQARKGQRPVVFGDPAETLALPAWHQLGRGRAAGRMTDLALHPDQPDTAWAAAAGGGVWKTTDRGRSWRPLFDQQATLVVGALALDPRNPDIVWAGTGEANYAADNREGIGILRSMDGGANWACPSFDQPDTPFARAVHELVVQPSGRVWAATDEGLVFSDDGVAWRHPRGLPAIDTTAVLFPSSPPGLGLAGLGAGRRALPGRGLWFTIDGGDSWSPVSGFPAGDRAGRFSLAESTTTPGLLYAAVTDHADPGRVDFLTSKDHGRRWTYGPRPEICAGYCWWGLSLAVVPPDRAGGRETVLLAAVSLARLAGDTWVRVPVVGGDDGVHDDHHRLRVAREESGWGVWSANDGGVNHGRFNGGPIAFDPVGTDLHTAQYYHVSADPAVRLAALGATQDQGTRYVADDTTFALVDTIDDGAHTAILIAPGGPVYYWSTMNLFPNLRRGSPLDSRLTQTVRGPFQSAIRSWLFLPFVADPAEPDRAWVGTDAVVEVGFAAGSIQQPLSQQLDPSYLTALARGADGRLWAGTRLGSICHQPEPATGVRAAAPPAWPCQQPVPPVPDRSYPVTSISPHPTDPARVVASLGGSPPQPLWQTNDGGGLWTDLPVDGLIDRQANRVLHLANAPEALILATDHGVFVRAPGTQRWEPLGSDLPFAPVDWIDYEPGQCRAIAATHGRGLWAIELPAP